MVYLLLTTSYKKTMRLIAKGKCGWNYVTAGIAVILTDDTTAEECANKIIIARSPTPEVVILLRNAIAIITETGGVLCHTAVIAMTMGIPFIVGAPDVLNEIKEGDVIKIVGNNGIGYVYKE